MNDEKRKAMTVDSLAEFLNELKAEGSGDALVVFDTEAQHFDCHMVHVSSAFLESDLDGEPIVVLHEDSPHRRCPAEDILRAIWVALSEHFK